MIQTDTLQPIQTNQRIIIVDILRGWALLGVAVMNYTSFYDLKLSSIKPANPDVPTIITAVITGIFFSAKSWTLLSLLFGYGFAVVINNVESKGINGTRFFIRRMFWLFVLAFINSSFYGGDILKDYALFGLIILLFSRISGKYALITSVCLIVLTPAIQALVETIPYPLGKMIDQLLPLYHSHNLLDNFIFNLKDTYVSEIIYPPCLITVHVVLLACMLLGLAAHRYRIFDKLSLYKRYVKRVFWYSLAVFIAFLATTLIVIVALKIGLNEYYNLRYIGVLSMMFVISSAICWLYISGKLKRFFRAMSYIGKMTLTNYIAQNVISFFVFSGSGLAVFNSKPLYFYAVFAVAIYILQIFLSRWWLKRFYYGPVEWIWRQLTYGKKLSLKRTNKPMTIAHVVYEK